MFNDLANIQLQLPNCAYKYTYTYEYHKQSFVINYLFKFL